MDFLCPLIILILALVISKLIHIESSPSRLLDASEFPKDMPLLVNNKTVNPSELEMSKFELPFDNI